MAPVWPRGVHHAQAHFERPVGQEPQTRKRWQTQRDHGHCRAGFGVRVTDTGQRTYILRCRFPGSRHANRRAIGDCGAISLGQARDKAREWLELVRKGIDRQIAEERQRQAELRQRRNTFAAVAEDFIADKLPDERKGREGEREIRRELLPLWGKRPIAEITAQDVRAIIRAAKDRGAPYQAHNLLVLARRLFSWAIDQQVPGSQRRRATDSSRRRSSARRCSAPAFSMMTSCVRSGAQHGGLATLWSIVSDAGAYRAAQVRSRRGAVVGIRSDAEGVDNPGRANEDGRPARRVTE